MANAQVPVTACDLCDSTKRVAWKCVQCDEVYCDACKNIHLKGKATKDHTINYSGKHVHDAYKMAFFCVNTDNSFNGAVVSVTPTTKKTAWVGLEREKTLSLYDASGECLKKVQLEHFISSLAVADDGNVYMTIPIKGLVVKMSQTFKIENVVQFEYLQPRGICITKSGHIVVTVVDAYGTQKNSDSVRLVYKLNSKGIVLETFGFDKSGTLMFTIPRRVKETTNGDLIVIDKTGDYAASIVCLDHHGTFRFRFQPSSDFNASDIAIDQNGGRIIIAEQKQKQILVIDYNGQFVQNIKTDVNIDEVPRSISFGVDRLLFVGYEKGKVALYEYCL